MSLTLDIADARWRKQRGLPTRLKKAVRMALQAADADETSSLTLLLASDKRVQMLNRDFRGFDKPTNVLSFPADTEDYLGDIIIAYGVTAKEAKESGKTFVDHVTHLTIHGVLHLLGYDHVKPRQAKVMETLEVRILADLGIANPYEPK